MSDLSLALTFKVVDEASAEFKRMSNEFTTLASKWEKLGYAIGATIKVGTTAAIAGLAGLTKQAIDSADQMGDTAQRMGISTESLSALAYAAKFGDVSLEQLKGGFNQLNKSIVESTDANSKAAGAFKYLGVETKNADGSLRKTDEVFKDVADKLSKMPDGASKAAVAMEVFGKSGTEMLPMLNMGKDGLEEFRLEAESLGLILSQETADQAGDFNDSIDRVGNAVSGASMALASELLPTLNTLAKELINSVKQGEGFKSFAEGVGMVFRGVVKVIATAISTVQAFGKGIGAIGAAIAAVASGDFSGAVNIFREYRNDVNAINKANEEFKAKVDASGKAQQGATVATTAVTAALKQYIPTSNKAAKAVENEEKAFRKALESLLKEADGYNSLTSVQKVNEQIATGAYAKLTGAHQRRLLEVAAEIDKQRELKVASDTYLNSINSIDDALRQSATSTAAANKLRDNTIQMGSSEAQIVAGAEAAYQSLTGSLAQYTDQLATMKALEAKDPGKYTKEISDLEAKIKGVNQAINERPGTVEKLAEAARQAKNAADQTNTWQTYIGGARDQMAELEKQEQLVWKWFNQGTISAEEFTRAVNQIDASRIALAAANLTDLDKKLSATATQIQGTFSDIFYNAMQGQFDNIFVIFKQMLDKMVAQALAAQVGEAIFGTSFTRGGKVSGQGGDMLSSLFSMFGFRANGGPVDAGKPYIVGEKRAEVFIPKQSGTILPNTDMLAGMSAGGMAVTFNIQSFDSNDLLANMDRIKRPLTELVSGTRRTYNMRTA